jgi:hypothetical protein
LSAGAEEALFPKAKKVGSMEDSGPGLDVLEAVVAEAAAGGPNGEAALLLQEHLDLVFKWVTLRLCERESVPRLR